MRARDLLEGSALPRHEAERLLAVVRGGSVSRLAAAEEIDETAADRFRELVDQRLAGEPLQYLEGTAAFGPLELVVDRRVLVPRPETEQLWELAVSLCEDAPRVVVDVCTGSGALALALKRSFPEARVEATDSSPEALEVAVLNGSRLGLAVAFRCGDLLDPLPAEVRGRVDLLVSNPPYVAEGEWEGLPPDVRREPRQALVAGPTGLETIRRLASRVPAWLASRGVVAVEIGDTQGAAAVEAFAGAGLDAATRRDLTGRTRFLVARRTGG